MKKLSKRKIQCIIVIIGLIIIPMFYSYFYLGAFWDPYSRLDSMPVAVVNNDAGATINDENRNIGEELCEELKEDASLKFIFTDEADAKSGTEGDDYYAMIVIPKDFSKNIASASTTEKQTATITYSPNEKRNYLASQILSRAVLEIEESTRASVNKELVTELADNIKAVPDQMTELQDGVEKLADGSTKLTEGTDTLAEGTATFSSKFTEYQSGVTDLKEGSTALKKGTKSLDSGIDDLLEGANTLVTKTTDINDLSTGAATLAAGAKTFNDSLIQYTAGVDSLITSVNSTSAFLKQYATKVNPSIMKDPVFVAFITKLSDPANAQSIETLQAANTKMKAASQQIAEGTATLSEGTKNLPQLKKGLKTLAAGLKKAKAGSAKLEEGTKTLNSGVATLNSATTKLGDAATEISSGAASLNTGAGELNDGIVKAKDGIDESITDTNEQLETLDGLAEFAEAPVTVEQSKITSVENYGTAFAPYFLSLSLWVGALIIFVAIYLDADNKFKILSRESEHRVARSFIYLVIGFAQAIVLAIVLQVALGLEVANVPLYYVSCCLVSMVSIAIVQFLMVHLKDMGKFLSILLLILQLTSCGGTFPMETVPKIFNVLYPFMPMTYAVGLFKQAISGVNRDEMIYNGGILVAILVVFMALTIFCSRVKEKVMTTTTEATL